MKITKNGFYKLSDFLEENIEVESNLNIVFFDDGKRNKKVNIGENCRVEIFGFLNNIDSQNFEIYINSSNSILKLGYLLLSGNDKKLKSKIYNKVGNNYCKSDMKIISIVGNKGNIDFDGVLDISKGVSQVTGSLSEENIFVGNTGKVNFIPSLFVNSDDVKVSHSSKIERISDEKLFYLTSRGVSKNEALSIMLESYIKSLYKCISMVDNDFYLKLINEILEEIKNKNFIN